MYTPDRSRLFAASWRQPAPEVAAGPSNGTPSPPSTNLTASIWSNGGVSCSIWSSSGGLDLASSYTTAGTTSRTPSSIPPASLPNTPLHLRRLHNSCPTPFASSPSRPPTLIDLVNIGFGFNACDSNSILAAVYAEKYTYPLFAWCVSSFVQAPQHSPHTRDLTTDKITHIMKFFVSPTSTLTRSSIGIGMVFLRCYMTDICRTKPPTADPAQIPGLVEFCRVVAGRCCSLPPAELEDWDAVVRMHTGKSMEQIAAEYAGVRRP